MRTTRNRTLFASLIFTAASAVAASAAITITDDFTDGNDAGWSRLSPLSPFGAGGEYTFRNPDPGSGTLGYEIKAPASPNPGALGPGRAGSIRLDATYTTFYMQADITDWDETKTSMAMGFLARSSDFGLGTTDGYNLVLDADGDFYINRTVDEVPTVLIADNSFNLNPNANYRLTFSGDGSALAAQLFNLNDIVNPIATINAVDATYASGNSGVFVYDGSALGNQAATAVFDNYVSADKIPEPATLAIFGLGAGLLAVRRRVV